MLNNGETKILDRILEMIPTSLEMGLSSSYSWPLDSELSLDMTVAGLLAARDSDKRYSRVRIMSIAGLKPLVDKLLWSGKANNLTYGVRRMVGCTAREHNIILWNETEFAQSPDLNSVTNASVEKVRRLAYRRCE
jgi:hypothetical protein